MEMCVCDLLYACVHWLAFYMRRCLLAQVNSINIVKTLDIIKHKTIVESKHKTLVINRFIKLIISLKRSGARNRGQISCSCSSVCWKDKSNIISTREKLIQSCWFDSGNADLAITFTKETLIWRSKLTTETLILLCLNAGYGGQSERSQCSGRGRGARRLLGPVSPRLS